MAEIGNVQEYLDIAAVMILSINEREIVTMINQKGCEILGYKQEEILGKNWFDNFLPKKIVEEVKQVFQKLMKGEAETDPVRYFENPVLNKDGEERMIAWHNTILKDASGMLTGILSSGTDITEQRIIEQRLKDSEESYKNLVGNIQDIIVEVDLKRNFTYVSPKAYESLGYKPEELIGTSAYDIVHPDERLFDRDEIIQALKSGELLHVERKIKHKDGHYMFFSIVGNVVTIKGETKLVGVFRDISTQKEAEQNLRESEARFRTAIESLPFDVFALDENECYYMQNSTCKKNWGDIIGKHPEDVATNDETLMLWKSNNRRALSGEVVKGEVITERVGSKRNYYNVISPIIDKGETQGILGVNIDITELKNTQEELRESEEKFRDITEQNLMGISILQENVIKYTNKAMTDIYGYSVDEVINWGAGEYLKIIAPDSLEFVKEQAIKKQKGDPNQLVHYRVHGVKKTGEFVWVDNFSKKIMYEGRPADIITQIDITEKIEAEQKLKESEEKFKKIFEESPLGIGFSDSEGRMLNVNRGFLDLFGVEKLDDLENVSFFDDPNLIEMRKNKIIAGEITEFRSEFNFDLIRDVKLYKTSKSGIRTFHTIIAPLVIDAKHNYISLIQDVTETELAKKELEISEEKYRHAYNQTDFYKDLLAHDIGNILNNIQSSVELYRIWEGNESKGNEREEMIKIIERQVGRGASLISNVRRLSEVEQTQLKIIPVEAKTLLEDVMKPIRGMYEDKTIDLSIEATQDTFILRGGDFLYDVFDNIIRNGVIHNDNESIKVQIKMYKIQKDEQNYVKLEFMDNGHGISDPRKLSIFERDYQKDRSRGGLGIGLSLVKKIVGLYNGQIWVEDRVPGDHTQGSNFIVLLKEAN